jgi:enamine deaminase RidA (YjgF/YER057c/UK114 family)
VNSNTASPLPKIAPFRKAGPVTFLCGQVAVGPQGTRTEAFIDEARLVFENLKATVAEAGGVLEDVVSVRAYLTDFENFADFNQVWSENFPVNPPARTTVQAGLVKPFRIELEAVAHI